MLSVKAIPLALSAIGISLLAGCAMQPQATWTDLGTGSITTQRGRITCYTDANMIDGERTEGTLCATPTNGFFSDRGPGVYAGVGYKQPIQIPISNTLEGFKLHFDDQVGLLKCNPLKTETGKTIPESTCTLTLNGQKLVSTKITFAGMK